MRSNSEAFRRLADVVESLVTIASQSGQDSPQWEEAATRLRVLLGGEFAAIYPRIPHDLEHYLDDSYIRARDAEYCKRQEDMVKSWLPLWRAVAAAE